MSANEGVADAQETPKADAVVQPKDAAQPEKVEGQEAKAAAETEKLKEDGNKDKQVEAPKEQKPVVPEKYDLKLPEGSLLEAAQMEKISAYAKEKGLSNEQAQELLERENDAVSGY